MVCRLYDNENKLCNAVTTLATGLGTHAPTPEYIAKFCSTDNEYKTCERFIKARTRAGGI